MKCQVCQHDLPDGVTYCPECGAHVYGHPVSTPESDKMPTVLSNPYDPHLPATRYGESIPPPPPPSYPPTEPIAPTVPVPNPYTPPVYPYSPSQSPGDLSSRSIPRITDHGPGYQPVSPNRKRNRLIILASAIVALALIVTLGAVSMSRNGPSNPSSSINITPRPNSQVTAAPSPTSASRAPDASQIDPAAAVNLTNPRTSSGIDSNDQPIDSVSHFSVGQKAYITFVHPESNDGYEMAQIYLDGNLNSQTNAPIHFTGNGSGVVSFTIEKAGNYVAALYWCQQADCSDGTLAQVVSFTAS